jgi:hypothetical protein
MTVSSMSASNSKFSTSSTKLMLKWLKALEVKLSTKEMRSDVKLPDPATVNVAEAVPFV